MSETTTRKIQLGKSQVEKYRNRVNSLVEILRYDRNKVCNLIRGKYPDAKIDVVLLHRYLDDKIINAKEFDYDVMGQIADALFECSVEDLIGDESVYEQVRDRIEDRALDERYAPTDNLTVAWEPNTKEAQRFAWILKALRKSCGYNERTLAKKLGDLDNAVLSRKLDNANATFNGGSALGNYGCIMQNDVRMAEKVFEIPSKYLYDCKNQTPYAVYRYYKTVVNRKQKESFVHASSSAYEKVKQAVQGEANIQSMVKRMGIPNYTHIIPKLRGVESLSNWEFEFIMFALTDIETGDKLKIYINSDTAVTQTSLPIRSVMAAPAQDKSPIRLDKLMEKEPVLDNNQPEAPISTIVPDEQIGQYAMQDVVDEVSSAEPEAEEDPFVAKEPVEEEPVYIAGIKFSSHVPGAMESRDIPSQLLIDLLFEFGEVYHLTDVTHVDEFMDSDTVQRILPFAKKQYSC